MEKILVVEDEEDLVALIRYNLAKEAFQVRDADSGEAALELAAAEPFDYLGIAPDWQCVVSRSISKLLRTVPLPALPDARIAR